MSWGTVIQSGIFKTNFAERDLQIDHAGQHLRTIAVVGIVDVLMEVDCLFERLLDLSQPRRPPGAPAWMVTYARPGSTAFSPGQPSEFASMTWNAGACSTLAWAAA